jgi:ornithine carbamoyltransferase
MSHTAQGDWWNAVVLPHLLSLLDVDRQAFEALMADSARWKGGGGQSLPGRARRVATVFDGPAFRTRLAFDTAICNLGAHRVDLPLQLGEREPITDTAAILSDAVDAVVIRTSNHDAVTELAAAAQIPVINAMTRAGHPCEVVSEAFTVRERLGSLDGLHVTFVGEDTNLCRSWCELTTMYDLTVTQVCPDGWELDTSFLGQLRDHGQRGQVSITHDLDAGVSNAHVIYTDGWPAATRHVGSERKAFEAIRIGRETLDLAGPDVLLMHCMPVRRGDEVTAAAFDEDPRSVTLSAKANLGPTHTAIVSRALADR